MRRHARSRPLLSDFLPGRPCVLITSRSLARAGMLAMVLAATAPALLAAQQGPLRVVAEPEALVVEVGASAVVTVRVVDAAGATVDVPVRLAGPRGAISVRDGRVQGNRPGDFELVATAALPAGFDGPVPTLRIPVRVRWPAIARVELSAAEGALYVGTTRSLVARAYHADGSRRPEPTVSWTSSAPSVAAVDAWGTVTAHAPGAATITATAEGASRDVAYRVEPFPFVRLAVDGGASEARTGDVLTFVATGHRADGATTRDLPVTWAYTFVPDDSIAAPGAPAIMDDGAFVAEVPGRYTVLAISGPLTERRTVRVTPREVVRQVTMRGQGAVRDQHTSDLWVFEGTNGRDYAITGTWGADGWAYFWDVTDPAAIVRTDSIRVDARTVNDVKVAPNGRWAALSREGASDRRNGVVILDLADPTRPTVASTYQDHGLTGGVHNMFATDEHLFALAGGDKYVILDMSDPYAPSYVSEYNHPDSRVHDVWVHDGIAYSSEWQTGVVVVDVGNGRWGGSIENPVFVTNVPYPVGATHAAFPYFQESTGKFYLFLGDEILNRRGAAFEGYGSDDAYDPETGQGGVQSPTSGYVHIIDFTDPESPRDVARYEVPEAGTHNIWVEDDVLYQAYYEGGLRVVDVSGELMGNLARQGREIAVFKPFDVHGYLPNQPNVWGPQPYKGHVFFSDFSSGLWAVQLQPRSRPVS